MRMSRKQQILSNVRRLPGGALWAFAIKQAWAALFGGLMLAAIIFTTYVHLPILPRYDWLFIFAVLIQAGMLAFKLEQPREVMTIALFHIVGLCMELFKTSDGIGSWSYPEQNYIRIMGVPLFSGFMYAAVGSYLARAWRVLELRFVHYPNRIFTIMLAIAIYANFYLHHYMIDTRYILFAIVAVLYWRASVYYKLNKKQYHMPILLGFVLIALFIWLAENIGTFTKVWLYPDQVAAWRIVGIQKLGSWLLLMIISFIMIDLLYAWHARHRHRAGNTA